MKIRRLALSITLALPLLLASCWIQTPPAPTVEELDKGLIVLYPGISSLPSDMIKWYDAFRAEGIDRAIEVISYGPTLDLIGNLQNFDRNAAFSRIEALRIAAYMDAYPGRPVTLIGYSGGTAIAVLTTAALPDGYSVDQILLFSSGLSAQYDLTPALDRSKEGIVHFWSPVDELSLFFTNLLGTMDGYYDVPPAATVGFAMEDERLRQWTWTEDMRELGNDGDHTDYLWNEAWLRVYLPPLLTGHADDAASSPIRP